MSGVSRRASGIRVQRPALGFSLIEIMVALTLGLLASLGIVTVFSAASSTNRVQEALARLQESGRYASTRLASDLRMLGGQYCNNSASSGWKFTSNGGVFPGNALTSYAPGVSSTAANGAFPDSGGSAGAPPAGWANGYQVSPALFVQGYECSASGPCTPQVPDLPAAAVSADARVPYADVLTLRYQSSSGWSYTVAGTGAATVITLGSGGADNTALAVGDFALITKCGGGQILRTDTPGPSLSSTTLPATFVAPDPTAGLNSAFDARVFNFSRDFTTVTYFLQFKADPNVANRLVPVLMRRVNGGAAIAGGSTAELVEGVERLDFVYGVQYADGTFHYMNADGVQNNSNPLNCLLPGGVTDATGCLWAAVQTVDVHMLVNTAKDLPLSDAEETFRYGIDRDASNKVCQQQAPNSASAPMTYACGTVTTGYKAGRMMRREFVSTIGVRNGNR